MSTANHAIMLLIKQFISSVYDAEYYAPKTTLCLKTDCFNIAIMSGYIMTVVLE